MMSAFRSSCEDEHDDMIITLLLLATYDLAINKTPLFHENLTVAEVRRRRSSKIWHRALQHPLSSPFWTLSNSKHDDALITLCGFDPFTPCGEKRNSLSRILQKNPVNPDCCVPSVVWHLGWHGLELVNPI